MILNDLERRNSPYFAFFTELDIFSGKLYHNSWRQTYNVRKILSPSSSLPLLAKIRPITLLAARSLCDSWASCWNSCCLRPTSNIMFRRAECSFSWLRRLTNYTRSTMDQERLSSLAMCTIQRETANKIINTCNDTELLITNLRENIKGIHTISDQMLMYILIFGLTYCICSIRISLHCMYPV